MEEIVDVDDEKGGRKMVSVGMQTDSDDPNIPDYLLSGGVDRNLENFSSLQQMVKDEGLSYVLDDDSIDRVRKINEIIVENFKKKVEDFSRKEPFHLGDVLSPIQNSAKVIVEDDFWSCFAPTPIETWTSNIIFSIFYLLGALVRWLILLPVRMIFLLLATIVMFLVIFIGLVINNYTNDFLLPVLRYALRLYSEAWLLSIGGVVFQRSSIPARRPNQVFVANHTTVLDIAYLLRSGMFSMIGQNNAGFIQILQFILKPMDNIFFERMEKHDRVLVKMKLETHMKDITKPPLLIFPEGVCPNNRYCVQFKKGAFELKDVEICPIAIKYDLKWNDAMWYEDHFVMHVLRLMRGWATPCEVHFLEPQKIREGETSIDFAHRVKTMISRKIGLKNKNWNGYLRYFTASERMLNESQKVFANRIHRKFERSEMNHVNSSSEEQEGENEETL